MNSPDSCGRAKVCQCVWSIADRRAEEREAGCKVIALEDLRLDNMTRRCKAKPSEDGNYLPNGQAAKSGLNRSLLSRVLSQIEALVLRNWLVGAHLIEFEQSGEDRARYGKQLLSNLAGDLRVKGLKGLGISMLKNCRQFYRIYPQIRQSLIGEFNQDPEALSPDQLLRLSWTHFIELIRTEDPLKRAFYEVECVRGNWSVRQLQRQIGSLLYERTGLSINKEAVVRRADKQEQSPPIAALLRDPYILEFAGLAERPSYSEADLETALLDHLQAFLLELGTGFCFEVDVIVLVTERNALLPGC